MTSKPPPTLPVGNAGTFSGITDNFSFHASPESFLSNYALRYQQDHPEHASKRLPIRAKILNRNVVVVSAYRQIIQVLDAEQDNQEHPSYSANASYKLLMDQFFPPPNLLLTDGCPHAKMKSEWSQYALNLETDAVQANIKSIAGGFLSELPRDQSFDLYDKLKDLSWQLFLGTFLDLDQGDPEYAEIMGLQENLLRGQFSLLPISINTGFWHSPRKVGIDARKKLQKILGKRKRPSWLGEGQMDEVVVNHLLMASSSLAVKGFSSLLLAFLLNAFLFQEGSQSVTEWIHSDHAESESKARAVLNETLRLSPPIVGVMRRTTKDCTLASEDDQQADTLVPTGWDAWTYFAGGNRDANVFGGDADLFRPKRYLEKACNSPIAFGIGPKTCLGQRFTRSTAITVLKAFSEASLRLDGEVNAAGVRGWLGWEIAGPEQWARDIKQLPTQRPSKPTMVSLKQE